MRTYASSMHFTNSSARVVADLGSAIRYSISVSSIFLAFSLIRVLCCSSHPDSRSSSPMLKNFVVSGERDSSALPRRDFPVPGAPMRRMMSSVLVFMLC